MYSIYRHQWIWSVHKVVRYYNIPSSYCWPNTVLVCVPMSNICSTMAACDAAATSLVMRRLSVTKLCSDMSLLSSASCREHSSSHKLCRVLLLSPDCRMGSSGRIAWPSRRSSSSLPVECITLIMTTLHCGMVDAVKELKTIKQATPTFIMSVRELTVDPSLTLL